MLITCTQPNLDLLKRRVMAELPRSRSGANPFGSGHVTEAIAASIGFSSNAALKAAISRHDRPWPLLRRLDAASFVSRLAQLTPFLVGMERPDQFFGGGGPLISDTFEAAWNGFGYSPPTQAARGGGSRPLLVPESHREGRLVAVAAELGRSFERNGNQAETLHIRLSHEGGTDFSCDVSDRPNGGPFQVSWATHGQIRKDVEQGLGDGIGLFAEMLAWDGVEGHVEEEVDAGLATLEPLAFRTPAFAPRTGTCRIGIEVWPRLVRYTHHIDGRPLPPELRPIGAAQFAAIASGLSGIDPADPIGAELVLGIVPSQWERLPPAA